MKITIIHKRRAWKMKKKISLILALALAASMLASCKKTDEETAGLPDTGTTPPSLTQMTMPEEEETTTADTTTAADTESESDTETESETSESETAAESETTTTTASETTAASESETTTTASTASTTAKKEWSETEISETLYITTACYSRTKAIVGSDSVKKYDVGTKINIVAATDTGYYKLADGTFIHSDYVSDEPPSEKTTTKKETAKTKTTTNKSNDIEKPSNNAEKISSSYTKSYTDRYPYQQLSSSEKQLYRNIVEAAESFRTEVTVPDGLMTQDIYKIYCLVYNNEPQLFWLSTRVPSGYGTISLNYSLTRDQAESTQAAIDQNVKDIMKTVGSYSSTISRLKVIYDWVITNNTFSLDGTFATCSVYNGLTGNGTIQCQGYAKSILYLCDVAGIDCMVVNGKNTEGDTHAWNVVYCDNGYYILDSTWGDPIINYGQRNYARYLFFLANDSMIKNTHLSVSTVTMSTGTKIKLYDPPACTKSACYYFKAYNKEYDDLDSSVAALYNEIDEAIASGKQVAHVRVDSHKTWETMTSNDYWRKFQDYAKDKSSDVKEIKRQRTLTEDILVVEYDIVYK